MSDQPIEELNIIRIYLEIFYNGKFKCGLRVDEDLNGDVDFALA